MLEYATYSVISPEGCAAILWKDQKMRAEAAEALRLTAPDLLELGLIDGIIPEPLGAAHSDPEAACTQVGNVIDKALNELSKISTDDLIRQRYERFRKLGAFQER